ncbi:MAG: energy transducer TonB [Prolixibacteraceae bacterium]
MNKILFSILILIPLWSSGERKDTTFYFGVNGKISDIDREEVKKEIDYRSANRIKITTFSKKDDGWQEVYKERIRKQNNGTWKIRVKGDDFSELVSRKFEYVRDSLYKFTDVVEDRIKRTGFTKTKFPLIFHGTVTEYYLNGNKKSVSEYRNNELVSNENWLENGERYIDNIFYSVDQEPLFLEGMRYLHKHVLKTFNESGLDISQTQGTIKVGFVVMKNGSINGIKIEDGINSTVNNLALRAIRTLMGEWKPAVLDGEEVRCFQIFPINFIYTEYDYDYVDLRGGMLYWEIN